MHISIFIVCFVVWVAAIIITAKQNKQDTSNAILMFGSLALLFIGAATAEAAEYDVDSSSMIYVKQGHVQTFNLNTLTKGYYEVKFCKAPPVPFWADYDRKVIYVQSGDMEMSNITKGVILLDELLSHRIVDKNKILSAKTVIWE